MPFSHLSGIQIRDAVVAKNPLVTKWFFFESCRPLFLANIRYFFNGKLPYDEYVNTIYIYLMEGDGRRLRSYDGSGSIHSWMKKTVYNLTLSAIEKDTLIENETNEPLYDKSSKEESFENLNFTKMDLERLLVLLEKENKIQAYVIKRNLIDDIEAERIAEELGTTVTNVYNIKSRGLKRILPYLYK